MSSAHWLPLGFSPGAGVRGGVPKFPIVRSISPSVFLSTDDTSPVSAIAALPPPGSLRIEFRSRLAPGAKDLSLSTSQHELIRHCLATGLERSRERLADTPASSTVIDLEAVTSSTLSDLDPDLAARGLSGDLVAGVLQRFEGRLTGTALLAMDPGDALLWLQRGDDDADPLGRFVDWGSRILAGVMLTLASTLQQDVTLAEPTLDERPLMAALLGTHAPSDTMVLSLHGELGFPVSDIPEIRAPFSIQLLLEPKIVEILLAGLAGDGPSA